MNETVLADLAEIRERVDAMDERLVRLLAERFALTHRIGLLKASERLAPLDARREREKLAALKALGGERGLNPDMIADLFGRIMREVVDNHERLR